MVTLIGSALSLIGLIVGYIVWLKKQEPPKTRQQRITNEVEKYQADREKEKAKGGDALALFDYQWRQRARSLLKLFKQGGNSTK